MASAVQSIIMLQKPSFAWKNHSHHSPQFQNYFSGSRYSHIKTRRNLKKLGVNCSSSLFMTNNNSAAINERVSQIKLGEMEAKQKPTVETVAETLMNMLKALRKPAVAALVAGLLLMCRQNSALAASGGRMGGSSFSSRSSSSGSGSYSSSSGSGSSSSRPSSGLGSSSSRPSSGSGSSSSGSRSSSSRSSSGWGSYSSSSPPRTYSTSASPDYETSPLTEEVEAATVKTSVLKLQVGVLGSGRSLQKALNEIAETADTSASEGLHYVLIETVVALLRHPDYCISGYSSVDVKRSMEAGEKKFNQSSVEERGKFDEETLVNVNNIKKKSSTTLKSDGFTNEYIVVTILVAAEGEHKLPSINSSKDLKEALQKLASITSTETLAVEVLWTPQKENDTLSELELREDYPLLRPLQ